MHPQFTEPAPLCACGCQIPVTYSESRHCWNRFVQYHHWHNRSSLPFADRFWRKVDKTGDCWLWTAGLYSNGYGLFTTGSGSMGTQKSHLAHRVSYELIYGPIEGDLQVCHSCDINYPPADITYRRCVRPDHLFLGTSTDNHLDMIRKGRWTNPSILHPERVHRGENHYATKLNWVDVQSIRARHAAGETTRSLATSFDVHFDTIWGIVKGLQRRDC